MKIETSPLVLSKVINIEKLAGILNNFTNLTKIDVAVVDIFGKEVLSKRINPNRSICNLVKGMPFVRTCDNSIKYGIFKSADLGEPYTFKCGEMIRCIAPIFVDDKVIGGIALGPVLLWDSDDFAAIEFHNLKEELGFNDYLLNDILEYTTKISCEYMNNAVGLLSLIVGHICQENNEFFKQRTKIMMQQRRISELIQEKKETKFASFKRTNNKDTELEKEFISLVQLGEKEAAMNTLNEIFGTVISRSKGNLDVIKNKTLELLTDLSKSANIMGTHSMELSSIMVNYIPKIMEELNFDKIFFWVNEAVDKMTIAIYNSRGYQKSNEYIIKAINFIKTHYSDNITLNDVAEHAYVSPYYLSHLFQKELGITFINYLIKIRIDNAILLIQKGEREVQNIAYKVGFNNSSYFIKVFKNMIGITPYKYIKVLNENIDNKQK